MYWRFAAKYPNPEPCEIRRFPRPEMITYEELEMRTADQKNTENGVAATKVEKAIVAATEAFQHLALRYL